MSQDNGHALPLAGVRVLDLSLTLPGPYASLLLGQLGAIVTRVVPPWGDPAQEFLPALDWLHQDKVTLRLDLKDKVGPDRQTLLDEAGRADIFMEGFRPGVAARLGVDREAIGKVNPRIVYCSLSGYGQTGSFRQAPGHDINYESLAGVVSLMSSGQGLVTGAHPLVPLSDLALTVYALVAILAGLRDRDQHGRGCYLDVAAADSIVSLLGPYLHARASGEMLTKDMPHYGTFKAGDGQWLSVGVIYEQHFWTRLVGALALPSSWADLDVTQRAGEMTEIRDEIERQIAKMSRDECVDLLRSADVPVMAVQSPREALFGDHFQQRGVVTRRGDQRHVGLPFSIQPLDGGASLDQGGGEGSAQDLPRA